MSKATEYRNLMNQLATRYRVDDVIFPESRIVFLLESPHVQELRYGAPVCGTSGASMTKHLFGDRYGKVPLGRLMLQAKAEVNHQLDVRGLGLMNTCIIPMQSSAYGDDSFVTDHTEFFQHMERVRTSNHKDTFLQVEEQAIQNVIVASLQKKLKRLTEKRLVFAPCGRFAEKFFRLSGVTSEKWEVIPNLAHPSRAGWSKAQSAPAVKQIVEVLSKTDY